MSDSVAGTRATYDVIGAAYANRWASQPDQAVSWITDWAGRVFGALPAGARVADVGCGPGQHTVVLRDMGFRVAGFDVSTGMLTALGVPGLVQADMRALPLAEASVDAIWCSASLLHIERPDVPGTLAEFGRVLRPDGHLALTLAEGDGEGWEDVPYQPDRRRWYVRHRLGPLTALLQAAGLITHGHWRRGGHRDWLHVHAVRR